MEADPPGGKSKNCPFRKLMPIIPRGAVCGTCPFVCTGDTGRNRPSHSCCTVMIRADSDGVARCLMYAV